MTIGPVVEVFESIQGEGQNLGKPSIFVRLWGCNLRCRFKNGNCDTPYAVHEERTKVKDVEPEELIQMIKKYKTKHIVWTGGEPLLQQDFIIEVMSQLMSEGYTGEIETNGTIPITSQIKYLIHNFNVSQKLKSSNQFNEDFENTRTNITALQSFPPSRTTFKFVITKEEDIGEVLSFKTQFPFKVYLMPQGTTKEEVIENSKLVVDLCIKHGFIFSPREHIIIWDSKRGV